MARHAARGQQEEPNGAWKLVLALWIAFIWVHSLIPGPASSEESMLVVRLVRPLFALVGVTDADVMQLIIRKGAHFSEYAALGALAVVALRPRLSVPLWPAVLTALLWAGVPAIDETIQLYVPGRAGMLTDVLIDMCGYALGVLVALVVRRRAELRRRAREEREHRARQARAAQYRRKAREAAYARAGKPLPKPKPKRSEAGPRHAPGVPVVPRGRHERIAPEPERNRRRFEDRTRE